MSNYKDKIQTSIDNLADGSVFISSDFLDIADYETVRKSLNRLVNEGVIHRIVNGVYYRPRYIELIGEYEAPSINEVATAIARKYNWTIAPSGNTALNLLGLSTQVPSQWTYISDGRYVNFTIGNTTLVFKRTTNSSISRMSQLTAMIIQAIKAMGKNNISEEQIRYLISEDIDLILDWQVIGYGKNEPWQERSNTKQDKFNKESNQKSEEFLRNILVPQMRSDFVSLIEDEFQIDMDPNDPQTVLFAYPTNFHSDYVKQVIRLEIGALAAWTPSEIVEITPELYKIYPMLFVGESIPVRTVLPERTFWEKATILHHEANRPFDSNMPIRYARHYYDIYCLAHSIYKSRAFENRALLDKVVSFKEKFYPRKWAKYEEATIEKIRLLPDPYRLKEVEVDYKQMKEMFFGNVPTFDEVVETIASLETEIHRL